MDVFSMHPNVRSGRKIANVCRQGEEKEEEEETGKEEKDKQEAACLFLKKNAKNCDAFYNRYMAVKRRTTYAI